MNSEFDVVTGAFGYIGRFITSELLEQGRRVRTITTHVDKANPFGSSVAAYPYNFDKPNQLTNSLQGATVLYNTYWIRFEYGGMTFDQAVGNTRILFRCAAVAGVKKIVHISVTHASPEADLPYYAGKGRQELALKESGLPFAIIRPTLVFGAGDILVNNIAWLLRKFPIFPIIKDGDYKLQPVYAGDLASIAVSWSGRNANATVDAIGPEELTYRGLVQSIANAIGRNVRYIHVSPSLGLLLGKVVSLLVRDILLTRDELHGLMANLLTSNQQVNGSTLFSQWLVENKSTIGRAYTSELARHFQWSKDE